MNNFQGNFKSSSVKLVKFAMQQKVPVQLQTLSLFSAAQGIYLLKD